MLKILALFEIFIKNPWLVPAVFFGMGIVLGLAFEYIVLPIMSGIAQKTKWKFDDVFINSLRGIVLTWIICGGAHLAANSMPITTTTMPTFWNLNQKAVKVQTSPVIADVNTPVAGTGQAVAEQINL
jgi:hypothetical protein